MTIHLFPRERGVASKTHAFNDSVLLERLAGIAPAVLQRMRECEREVPLLVTRAVARV